MFANNVQGVGVSEAGVTKRQLRLKYYLGLPSWVLTIFLALVFGGHNWLVYIFILIFGWYLYNLLYWKLYERLMNNRISVRPVLFYIFLIGYQLLLVGCISVFFVV
jgi:hypothetical protein